MDTKNFLGKYHQPPLFFISIATFLVAPLALPSLRRLWVDNKETYKNSLLYIGFCFYSCYVPFSKTLEQNYGNCVRNTGCVKICFWGIRDIWGAKKFQKHLEPATLDDIKTEGRGVSPICIGTRCAIWWFLYWKLLTCFAIDTNVINWTCTFIAIWQIFTSSAIFTWIRTAVVGWKIMDNIRVMNYKWYHEWQAYYFSSHFPKKTQYSYLS